MNPRKPKTPRAIPSVSFASATDATADADGMYRERSRIFGISPAPAGMT